MKVVRSTCCNAPVLSTVEPIGCQFCNVIAKAETATLMIYKCMKCGLRCETKEAEEDEII